MAISTVTGPVRSTRPRTGPKTSVTSTYSTLLERVRDAGLLKKRPGFYITLFISLALATAGVVGISALLGDSWFQLIVAGVLGVLLTQFAFIAHEASHRQIFAKGTRNDRIGRILANAVVGMSYSWWMNKHSRHHANPNQVGKDPDIERDTVSFLEKDAALQTGFMGALTRRQGYLFFPLLIGEGVNLHVLSFRYLFSSQKRQGRALELTLIGVRLAAYLALVFWVFPLGMGFAFVGVQMAVFGIYMGASFAPNHMGMPIIAEGERLDFLNKQVRTSRNIRGRGMSAAMGGLNYQVEHHLFPSMSRPSLARASRLVQEHCATLELAYTQTSLMQAYGTVVRYMNRVGLVARDPFDCPMAGQYRRP